MSNMVNQIIVFITSLFRTLTKGMRTIERSVDVAHVKATELLDNTITKTNLTEERLEEIDKFTDMMNKF